MIRIEWENRMDPGELLLSHMEKAAAEAVRAEGITVPCIIHVCLCDDDQIAAVNRECRGIDAATDVLSFPSVDWPSGYTAGQCPALLRREYDDEARACFLGDIMISIPHLVLQAQEYGHTQNREGCYLLVHGICHLMGYDHIDPEEQKKMRNMEERILSAIHVPRE